MIRTIVLFTIIYTLLYHYGNNPMEFESNIDPLYFAVTLTSSVGLGDYTPKTNLAKSIVIIHMLTLFFDIGEIFQRVFKVKIY